MNTLFFIIAIVAIVIARTYIHYSRFTSRVASGHPIYFYNGEERTRGIVTRIENGTVTINTGEGIAFRSMNDIYPVLGCRY